jgi:hypothetical protein
MDRHESEALDRHITGNGGEDQFRETRNLVMTLLKNNVILTRQEEVFNVCVSGLSDNRRRAVYQYVATLKDRIRLLTESIEEQARDFQDVAENLTAAQTLLEELRGMFNDKRETENETRTLGARPEEASESATQRMENSPQE